MRTKISIACVLMLAVFCGFEIYHQTGMVRSTKKNGFGCICHGFDPSTNVRVWITGPDSLVAGAEGTYRVHVAKTGNIAAGFNVAAFRGALGIIDSVGTQLERESSTDSLELTHTLPRFRNGRDTISWIFRYKAPFVGTLFDTIYAAGNAVNNDTLPDGDGWNFASNFLVRVVRSSGVDDAQEVVAFRLLQNYPNPFNPSTTIAYELSQPGRVCLMIFDATGKEVMTLVDEEKGVGSHSAHVEPQLASGIYLYRMVVTPIGSASSRQITDTKKMLFLK
jgi:hypothetical protein